MRVATVLVGALALVLAVAVMASGTSPVLILAVAALPLGLAAVLQRPIAGLYVFVGLISVYYFLETVLQHRFGLSPLTLSILSRWQILLLVGVALAVRRQNAHRLSVQPLDILMVSYLLLVFLYTPTAPSLAAAIYGLSNLTQFEVAYWAGRLLTDAGSHVAPLLLRIALPLACFGILQPWLLGVGFYQATAHFVPDTYFQETGSGLPRAMSLLGSPGYFGSFLMLVVPLALARLLQGGRVPRVWNLTLIVYAVALVASFHRSSWLGTAVACSLVVVLYARRASRVVVALASFGVVALISTQILAVGPVIQNVLSLQDFSTASHLQRAAEYVQLALDNPFGLGLGAGGNAAAFLGNADAPGLEGGYSQVVLQVGWLGLLCFALVQLFAITQLIRGTTVLTGQDKWVAAGTAGVLAGAIVFNLILPFQSFNPALMLLWLIVGVTISKASAVGDRLVDSRTPKPIDRVLTET